MIAPKNELKNNLPRKLFALLIAILIWSYVGSIDNPTVSRVFQIPVAIENLPENYGASLSNQEVSITVTGRTRQLQTLNVDDFSATLDLSQVILGDNAVKVAVSAPNGVKISRVLPGQIGVYVQTLDEKVVPLSVQYKGSLQKGLKLDGEARLEDTSVKIYANREILSNITHAIVVVDLSKYTKSTEAKLPVVFLDEQNNIVSKRSVKATKEFIKTQINVAKAYSKEVPIKVNLAGELPDALIIKEIQPFEKHVVISGDEKILHTIASIETEAVELTTINGTINKKVKLIIPKGISAEKEAINITLVIDHSSKIESNGPILLPVNVNGTPKSGRVSLSVDEVKIYYKNQNERPTYAMVDVTDMEPGSYDLPILTDGISEVETIKVTIE